MGYYVAEISRGLDSSGLDEFLRQNSFSYLYTPSIHGVYNWAVQKTQQQQQEIGQNDKKATHGGSSFFIVSVPLTGNSGVLSEYLRSHEISYFFAPSYEEVIRWAGEKSRSRSVIQEKAPVEMPEMIVESVIHENTNKDDDDDFSGDWNQLKLVEEAPKNIITSVAPLSEVSAPVALQTNRAPISCLPSTNLAPKDVNPVAPLSEVSAPVALQKTTSTPPISGLLSSDMAAQSNNNRVVDGKSAPQAGQSIHFQAPIIPLNPIPTISEAAAQKRPREEALEETVEAKRAATGGIMNMFEVSRAQFLALPEREQQFTANFTPPSSIHQIIVWKSLGGHFRVSVQYNEGRRIYWGPDVLKEIGTMPSEVVVNKLVFEKLNIDTAIFDEIQLFLDRLNVKRVDMAIFKDPYFISPQKWTPFFEKFGVLDIHVVGQARHEDLLLLARSNCHTFKVDGFVPDNCIVQELHRSARVALSPCLLVRGAKASKETIRVVLEECLKN